MKTKTLSLIIIVLLVNGRSLFAQDSTFTIQSFQPQNIKDGQIKLRLHGYNRGSSDKTQTAATPSEDENGSLDRQYSFRTSSWLKYESPKSFYYLNPNIYYWQNSLKRNNKSSSAKLYPKLDYSPFEESTDNYQSNYFDV